MTRSCETNRSAGELRLVGKAAYWHAAALSIRASKSSSSLPVFVSPAQATLMSAMTRSNWAPGFFCQHQRHNSYAALHCTRSTLCPQKNEATWCLIITLANVDRFSKFFHWFVIKFSMHTHKDFHLTCDMLLRYLVKVKNPKMLLILTAFSTNCWHVPENTLNTWQ